jgi:hypothetical protein
VSIAVKVSNKVGCKVCSLVGLDGLVLIHQIKNIVYHKEKDIKPPLIEMILSVL